MRRFFKIHQILPLFVPYWAPICASPWFSQTWIPIPQRYFLPNLVQINSVVSEKKSFKGKVYGRTTNDGWWLIPIAHFEPSAQVT